MKHFLFGVIFSSILFPLFEDIAQLFSSIFEVIILNLQKLSLNSGIEIAKKKKEIHKIMGDEDEEKQHTNLIGFALPSEEEDEEEEE